MRRFTVIAALFFFLLASACLSDSDAAAAIEDEIVEEGYSEEETDGEANEEEGGNGSEGVLVLAGGGAEGDVGDTDSWSYALYSALVENGDIHGDGEVRVAILATNFPSQPGDADWLGDYFVWIGDTLGVDVHFDNVEVDSQTAANDPSVVAPVADADVVFVRGGDQWEYVTWWGDSLLESHIRDVHAAGGAIGGTSAGAMSISSLTYASGQDMISTDVLYDSHTTFLDDRDGGSGIHPDFLPFLDNAVVDTHYTWRGRMGRLLGIHAKAIDDGATDDLVGIGIEEYTGLIVREGEAEVVGHGGVSFFTALPETQSSRDVGAPLTYTNVRLDRLADGWSWSLAEREPIPPANATAVETVSEGPANEGGLSVDGAVVHDADRFQWLISDSPFDLTETSRDVFVRDAAAYTHALEEGERGYRQETVFSALGELDVQVASLVFYDEYNGATGTVERHEEAPDQLLAGPNLASLFISGRQAEFQAPAANFDSKNGVPYTLGMSGLRVHVLADSVGRGKAFNSRIGQIEAIAEGDDPGNGDEDDGSNGDDGGETDAPVLNLDAYKVRGRHHVDLSWKGLTGEGVEVIRDGQIVQIVEGSGSYTDVPGGRGGGSYIYQVCGESSGECSEEKVANF
jgi:cyanophycinase